jgi:hypothetical protein
LLDLEYVRLVLEKWICYRVGSVKEVDEELWTRKHVGLTSPFLYRRKEQTKRSSINTEGLCEREKRQNINRL